MQNNTNHKKVVILSEELENTMACARWLVREFEQLNCQSLANLFQNSVEDAEVWISHMGNSDHVKYKYESKIKEKEAQAIHRMLIKYAGINDANIRKKIIKEMMNSVNLKLADLKIK